LNYLHQKNIVHRDIKLENVLMATDQKDDLTLKVTDFGFATVFDPKVGMTESMGSPVYMAPELVNKQTYGSAVDIWAAGILLHMLIIGDPPFLAGSKKELFMMIKKLEVKLVHRQWEKTSPELRDIVTQMLQKDPKLRPNA
jgi:serine/threonine protein kinase